MSARSKTEGQQDSRRMFRISSKVYRASMHAKKTYDRVSHNEYHDQFREYQIAPKQKSRVLLYERPKPKNSAPTPPPFNYQKNIHM